MTRKVRFTEEEGERERVFAWVLPAASIAKSRIGNSPTFCLLEHLHQFQHVPRNNAHSVVSNVASPAPWTWKRPTARFQGKKGDSYFRGHTCVHAQ